MTFEELKEQASRIQPCNGVEEDLLGFLEFEIGQAERVRLIAMVCRKEHILGVVRRDEERAEARDLGQRLFPTAWRIMHGLDISPPAEGSEPLAESGPKYQYLPPGPIVEQLESTEAGCRLLLEHWENIQMCFGGKKNWLRTEVFNIIRLMGNGRSTRLKIRKSRSYSWRATRSIAVMTTPSWSSSRRSGLSAQRTS